MRKYNNNTTRVCEYNKTLANNENKSSERENEKKKNLVYISYECLFNDVTKAQNKRIFSRTKFQVGIKHGFSSSI